MNDSAVPPAARDPRVRPDTRSVSSTRADEVREVCQDDLEQSPLDPYERSLVDEARRDSAAFAPLYRKYVTPLYRYFYQQVAVVEDAEDLTSTTFSKALAGLNRYETRGRFAAWLFGIARNTLHDYHRAHFAMIGSGSAPGDGGQADMLVEAAALADPALGPEAQVLRSEQAADLRQWVARLPEEQREALVLRIFGELGIRDIAVIVGKSEGAVKMLIHRAVGTLRAYYGQDSQEILS